MMKLQSTTKKVLTLLLLTVFLTSCQQEVIQDTSLQETETIQKKTNNSNIDIEKIDFLKNGLKKKIKSYNNKHRKKDKFFKKYGRLKIKNAVTIKFPNDDNFLVAVPFKSKKHKNKLLIAYYKNEVRKYTIIKKNKKYKKKKLAKTEKTFIKNSKLLFELTSGNINFNNNARSTITKSFGNCNPRVTNTEIISDCAALITLYFPCSDQTTYFVDSDKGCDNALDNIDLIGDNYSDPTDDPWQDPDIPSDPLDDYNEPDEGCDEMMFDCGEDGYGNEEEEEDDQIDYTGNQCVDDIIKKLQEKDSNNSTVPNLEGLNHLSQIILDLFDHSKEYTLDFDIKQLNNLGSKVNGSTNGFDIDLDTDLVNDATQLFISKTIIHESLHAFIHYTMREQPSSDMVKDLRKYYQKYKGNSNLTEHEFMGQYVEALAYSLSAYDNHRWDMSYYTKLSWGGLESSTAYQALKNKSDIQKAINNERYSKSGKKSTKC